MRTIRLAFALSAATAMSLAAASIAFAAPDEAHKSHGPHGDITIVDAEARAKAMFEKVDANHDGKITRAELAGAPRMPMAGMMMGHMRHGGPGFGPHEGGPPEDEAMPMHGDMPMHDEMHGKHAATMLAAMFKQLDTDKNGQLSADEFAKLPAAHRAQMAEMMFTHMDKNADGVLTADEFPPFVAHLKAMDKNGDGIVTKDEMRAAHPRHDHDGDDDDHHEMK